MKRNHWLHWAALVFLLALGCAQESSTVNNSPSNDKTAEESGDSSSTAIDVDPVDIGGEASVPAVDLAIADTDRALIEQLSFDPEMDNAQAQQPQAVDPDEEAATSQLLAQLEQAEDTDQDVVQADDLAAQIAPEDLEVGDAADEGPSDAGLPELESQVDTVVESPEQDELAELAALPELEASVEHEEKVVPFDELGFHADEGDLEQGIGQGLEMQGDDLEPLNAELSQVLNGGASFFLSEAASDAAAPQQKIREKVLYNCATKPCRLHKLSYRQVFAKGAVRSRVVTKVFTYSSKRREKSGDLNTTTAFRGAGKGRAAWVFVHTTLVQRYQHGNITEVSSYEYFQNRQRNASFTLRKVTKNLSRSVKQFIHFREFNQAAGDATADIAPRKRNGKGSVSKTAVMRGGKRRTIHISFTRKEGTDTGTVSGWDWKGRKKTGSFSIAHRGDGCRLNDTGTQSFVLTYPKTENPKIHRTKEEITIKIQKKRRVVEGKLTLSSGKLRSRRAVWTTIEPETCAEKQSVRKATVVGRRYDGARFDLTRTQNGEFAHVKGTITYKDGRRKNVNFIVYHGIRISALDDRSPGWAARYPGGKFPCAKKFECIAYCYDLGNRGVISYTAACTDKICACTAPPKAD